MSNDHERKYIILTKLMKEGKVEILCTEYDKEKKLLLCVSDKDQVLAKEVLTKASKLDDLLPLLVFKPPSIADGMILVESAPGGSRVDANNFQVWPWPPIFSLKKLQDALP